MLFVSAETVGLPLLEIKKLNCEEIMVAIKEAMARKTSFPHNQKCREYKPYNESKDALYRDIEEAYSQPEEGLIEVRSKRMQVKEVRF